jgi:hypothetical protein
VRSYGFDEQKEWSEGFAGNLDSVMRIIRGRIPGCTEVRKAQLSDDKQGTDYWADRNGLPPLSIDVKVRDEDYARRGHDDLALETWSVIGKSPGWTRNAAKRTDFVLWYWRDSGRYCLVSFPSLCFVFTRLWREWTEKYKTKQQNTPSARGGWQSECVFVPRRIVFEALVDRWACGEVAA